MTPILPLAIIGAGLAWFLGKGKKGASRDPSVPAPQADFPGGATGELYSAYMAALTGTLSPIAYGVLAEDLRYHGFEYEANQVAEYAMRMGPTWASQGWTGTMAPATAGIGSRRTPGRPSNRRLHPRARGLY